MLTEELQRKIAKAVKQAELDDASATLKINDRYVPQASVSLEGNSPERRLEVFAGVYKIVPWAKLNAAGWIGWRTKADRLARRPVLYVQPTEWVDMETGEILNKTKAGNAARVTGSISDRLLDALGAVNQCRESVRTFVIYILKMRNQRGGLVMDLLTLVDTWVRRRCGVDFTHRARKRKALIAALYGEHIMANSQTMTKHLQVIGNPTREQLLEEAAAFLAYFRPRMRPADSVESGEFSQFLKAESPVA